MLLAIETSCDETSVALVHNGRVLSNVVSSQVRLHAEYGGVVPELAVRAHLRNLPTVAREALVQAAVTSQELTAVAATQGPGLPSALMAGFTAAQAMAFALNTAFLPVHHHEAHLYSPWITSDCLSFQIDAIEPNVSLIVSGGHTLLVHVLGSGQHRVLGGTLDDAAGECFDKTARLIGLPYPGGSVMDLLAEDGDPRAIPFPRSLMDSHNDDFSFSGLKTAVRYYLEKNPAVSEPKFRSNLCASIRAAIVEVLVTKTMRAAQRLGVGCVTASGGVTANRALRRELASACARNGMRIRLTPLPLCTDNAAIVGLLAEQKLRAGAPSDSYASEVRPGWELE